MRLSIFICLLTIDLSSHLKSCSSFFPLFPLHCFSSFSDLYVFLTLILFCFMCQISFLIFFFFPCQLSYGIWGTEVFNFFIAIQYVLFNLFLPQIYEVIFSILSSKCFIKFFFKLYGIYVFKLWETRLNIIFFSNSDSIDSYYLIVHSLFSVLYNTSCWECLGGTKTVTLAGCPWCGLSAGRTELSRTISLVGHHRYKLISFTASPLVIYLESTKIMLRFSGASALCIPTLINIHSIFQSINIAFRY